MQRNKREVQQYSLYAVLQCLQLALSAKATHSSSLSDIRHHDGLTVSSPHCGLGLTAHDVTDPALQGQ